MERALVAQHVANKLFATENAIDQALGETSLFMGEILKARQTLGASAVLADEAFAKTSAAIAALTEARSAMVAAHGELADAKLVLGIRTKLAGTGPKKTGFSETAELREVG